LDLPREELLEPPLRPLDFFAPFRPLALVDFPRLAVREEPDFFAPPLRDLLALFVFRLDFFAAEDFAAPRLLPADFFAPPVDFRPREAVVFFEVAERPRDDFLPDNNFLELIPAALVAAPAACVTAALAVFFAVATFLGSLAALPAMAPSNPPTTTPTGPATPPITAPAAAPAVVLEIGGTSRLSEDEDSLPDDC